MYPGAMPMNAAASKPALSSFISFVNLVLMSAKAAWSERLHAHIGGPGSECTEARREEDTNVPDIDREVECMENVVDDAAGHHQARVDSASYNTTKRVPGGVVEPIPECL